MSYTLRDLPLPVKVVASVFLMAVGVGYSSAMVQLHLSDSKSGKPLPTVDDVVLKFTGKVHVSKATKPVCKIESVIMTDPDKTVLQVEHGPRILYRRSGHWPTQVEERN